MADFSRPEYASYVQLCRELGKEQECQMCSGFGRIAHDKVEGGSYSFVDCPLCSGSGRLYPSLADWLEMLEAAEVVGTVRDYYIRIALAAFDDIYIISAVWPSESLDGEGPTREEAAARLWMAVKKG